MIADGPSTASFVAGPPPPRHVVNERWFRWAVPVMVLGLVVLKFFTQLLSQMGV